MFKIKLAIIITQIFLMLEEALAYKMKENKIGFLINILIILLMGLCIAI